MLNFFHSYPRLMVHIFLMNFLFGISTTIGMTIAPILVTEGLGMSLLVFGMIEGGTEFISNMLKFVSGNLFDRVKNRRYLFIFPAAVNFVSKLLFFIPSIASITLGKILERMANGAFASPRDAYIGENAQHKATMLGALSMAKTAGCIVGPLIVSLTIYMLGALKDHMHIVIGLTCLINFSALFLATRLNAPSVTNHKVATKINYENIITTLKPLSLIFLVTFCFFLCRFNDGNIILFLKKHELPEFYYLSTISIFNAVMLILSGPMGYMVDSKKENIILYFSILSLLFFNILFLNLDHSPKLFATLGLFFWGVQRAGIQITLAAMIFKRISSNHYGNAIGIYSVISGVGTLIASVVAGYLFKYNADNIVFIGGGVGCTITLIIAMFLTHQNRQSH